MFSMKALLLAGENFIEKLVPVLREAGADDVLAFSEAGAALSAMRPDDCALVLLRPARDPEESTALAGAFARAGTAGVILLLPSGASGQAVEAAARSGVFALLPPISRTRLMDCFRLALVTHHRLRAQKAEIADLRDALDEIKLVNRAKLALAKYLNMSEPQAHRYIEKQAMDRRTTRLEIARSILANYGV